MEVLVIASGSSGNATLVSSGETSILVDIGISALAIRRRLDCFGRSEHDISAVVLSHEHSDHVKGLEVFLKRRQVPVWATRGTWSRLKFRASSGGELLSGETMTIGSITVTPVATSHDACEPVAFLLDDSEHRLAVCTDTGIFTALLEQRLKGCHLVMLEANHDPDMLRHGRYPWPLKQRIASRHGHLANHQTEEAVGRLRSQCLCGVVGLHLSEENNSAELVKQRLDEICGPGIETGAVARNEMLRAVLSNSQLSIEKRPAPPSGRKKRQPTLW